MAADKDDDAHPPPVLAWAIVAALFVAYIFSFIDRMIIGLLVEPMKADLGLSDTQISLLQGLAFALFYTIAGIPIGRLIDRAQRMRIVAAGVALWSAMTMACGVAGAYWQLFLFRMGVGVGEATLSPAAYSIIADSFPKRRLGVAMGVYGLGSAIGAGLAFMIGAGVIAFVARAGDLVLPGGFAIEAWQAAFLVVGAPGLLIAGLFMLLPEPGRGAAAPRGAAQPSLHEVGAFLRDQARPIFGLFFAVSLVNFSILGSVTWFPVLLMRVHGFSIEMAGYLAGGALIMGGLIGLIGGGWLCDRMGGAASARIKICGFAAFAGVAGGVSFPLADNPWMATLAFTLFFSAAALPVGAAPSALQQLTPGAMRATLSACYIFVVNIIGLGAGPSATAIIGDVFFPFQSGIRYAIVAVAPAGFLLAAGLFFFAARAMRMGEAARRLATPIVTPAE